MPLADVKGSVGAVAPLHIVYDDGLNVCVICGVTVTVTDAVVAHESFPTLRSSVLVAVLLTVDGLHVPVMPLADVKGSVGAVAPLHIVYDDGLNVGVICGVTVTVTDAVVAHEEPVGVNV